MDASRPYWPAWEKALQANGLKKSAAWLLQLAGPLTLLGAQFIYLASPLFENHASLRALASLLEDEEETQAFLQQLRGN
ncbi:MAG: hypothetical protein OHK0031_13620 [Anaerolineales bacterium]